MSSPSLPFPAAPARRSERIAGLAVTLAVHLALILAWRMAGTLPSPQQEGSDEAMLWLSLPSLLPSPPALPPLAPRVAPMPPAPARQARIAAPGASARAIRTDPVPAAAAPVNEAPPAAPPTPDDFPRALPGAADILANARRSVGEIDRALRKENPPLIVAPPDSPEIRMREGMEHARAMAPPRLWEAPKVEELVNNTGDGARRTRVISGGGTYCITERAPTTSIDMIEMHGKQRITSCPTHETPPRKQAWRTTRD